MVGIWTTHWLNFEIGHQPVWLWVDDDDERGYQQRDDNDFENQGHAGDIEDDSGTFWWRTELAEKRKSPFKQNMGHTIHIIKYESKWNTNTNQIKIQIHKQTELAEKSFSSKKNWDTPSMQIPTDSNWNSNLKIYNTPLLNTNRHKSGSLFSSKSHPHKWQKECV